MIVNGNILVLVYFGISKFVLISNPIVVAEIIIMIYMVMMVIMIYIIVPIPVNINIINPL